MLLAAWEEAATQHPLDRALTLLGAALPAASRAELAELSVGRRDGLLLELRERTYGPRLDGFVGCGRCGAELELELWTTALRQAAVPTVAAGDEFEHEGVRVRFRPLDSRDLAVAAQCADRASARARLVEQALIGAERDGEALPAAALPPTVVERLGRELGRLDPESELLLDLTCADCGESWQAPFDVASFLWSEVHASARRLLQEVDLLARSYGWSEPDILALSPRRRALYLELAGA